jgi:DNA mismatch repair ATPase MutS
MEIQQLRKEFNQLLDKINQHSERFTDEDHFPSLEASVMLSKINKLQELAAVLKFAIELNEEEAGQKRRNYQQAQRELKTEAVIEEIVEATEEEQIILIDEVIEIEEEVLAVVEEIKNDVEVEEEQQELKSSVSDKFSQTPISSLKDAFSLNDRYLFANELFNKDMNLFNEAIKTLDACENEVIAMGKLNEFGATYDWDLENEHLLSLQNKVQRRFL